MEEIKCRTCGKIAKREVQLLNFYSQGWEFFCSVECFMGSNHSEIKIVKCAECQTNIYSHFKQKIEVDGKFFCSFNCWEYFEEKERMRKDEKYKEGDL